MITSDNVPNLPGWLDLGSPDPAASAEFYRQVFGWTAEITGPESENPYRFLRKDGKTIGGLGRLQDPAAKSDWTMYVRVPDAQETIKAVELNGGKVRVPYMAMDEGGMAQFTDPVGAEFAVWQPGTIVGFEKCCEDDSYLWTELWTHDPQAAKGFYGEVFGWKTTPFTMAEGTYDMWTMDPADTESMASFGGIMQIAEGMPIQDEKWVPYFMVADADATVDRTVAAGGMVLMPAADAPPGRLAALTDQFGARFNLLKPAPMETPAG